MDVVRQIDVFDNKIESFVMLMLFLDNGFSPGVSELEQFAKDGYDEGGFEIIFHSNDGKVISLKHYRERVES